MTRGSFSIDTLRKGLPSSVMRKLARPGPLGDLFHKGFVFGCVGLTLYGMLIVGTRAHAYFTQIKPQRLEERRLLAEQEQAVAEASTSNQEDAETLKF